jgi:aspartate/methionine/tyrosine aminotransferase
MTHPATAQRIATFGTTIFTEMSALALAHNAVNLGQGFPDFAGPDFVKNAAVAAVQADLNQYAPMPGLPSLRQAIAATWADRTGREIDPLADVSISSGATEVLCNIMLAFVNPGDGVVMFEPAYDAYQPDVIMAGGHAIPVRLYPPDAQHNGWHYDDAALEAAFAQRPKLLLLNTPHNPTGKVFSASELQRIAELCQTYNVLAVVDEVYDRLVYDQHQHIHLASLPGMWERTMTVNSIGKTFSVTGWKIGWCVAPANLIIAIRATHQWVTFATSTPMQQASAVALNDARHNGYYDQLISEYSARRIQLNTILRATGLPLIDAEGSYFVSVDVAPLGVSDVRVFCRRLTSELGVAAIPIPAFYLAPGAPALARFCFAKKATTLAAAGERLTRLHDIDWTS